MGDGAAIEHAPLKTLLPSPMPHLLPSKGSNGQEQERGFAAEDEDKGDVLTTGLAHLKLEPTTDDPMLLEAAIHDGRSSMQLGRSTSWSSLGFISVEQPATGGPLFLDPSGIWTNDDTPMVTSSWIPPPDFLTGPSSDPMLEGAIEATSLPVLDADAERTALPAGLLISPSSSPPVTPPALPTTHHLPIQNTTPEPPQPNLFAGIVQEEDMENGSDDEGLDAYPEDITVQPDGSTQPLAPAELGGLAALLDDLMQPAPLPLFGMPEPVPVQLSAKPRRSERLSSKTTATLAPLQKAQVILMKKLDLLDETAYGPEEQKLRLLALFKGPILDLAVKAMENLLDDGKLKENKHQPREEAI
jgi:hypothetical protein